MVRKSHQGMVQLVQKSNFLNSWLGISPEPGIGATQGKAAAKGKAQPMAQPKSKAKAKARPKAKSQGQKRNRDQWADVDDQLSLVQLAARYKTPQPRSVSTQASQTVASSARTADVADLSEHTQLLVRPIDRRFRQIDPVRKVLDFSGL